QLSYYYHGPSQWVEAILEVLLFKERTWKSYPQRIVEGLFKGFGKSYIADPVIEGQASPRRISQIKKNKGDIPQLFL
ncbi:hypothetical protein HAX54_044551, partial [Datura stramonium]|nr:hypothetical protein [Datura stramonium]